MLSHAFIFVIFPVADTIKPSITSDVMDIKVDASKTEDEVLAEKELTDRMVKYKREMNDESMREKMLGDDKEKLMKVRRNLKYRISRGSWFRCQSPDLIVLGNNSHYNKSLIFGLTFYATIKKIP